MRSNIVSIIMALIVVVFAGSAYYYWHGGARSAQAITGVVTDKFQREAGTEAGGRVLDQGLRTLTGRSLEHDVFYFIRVRTDKGDEIDIEVSQEFFLRAQKGDKIRQASSDASPTVITSH